MEDNLFTLNFFSQKDAENDAGHFFFENIWKITIVLLFSSSLSCKSRERVPKPDEYLGNSIFLALANVSNHAEQETCVLFTIRNVRKYSEKR
jgi:hypothetical protein